MPRRKILLSTGGNNYRPPLERSKSAPKLFAIEEMVDEEEEDEDCNDEAKARKNEERKKLDDVKPCCKEDYLYPSITLGRRRCRRGHSIRKSRLLRGSILTQKSYPPSKYPASLDGEVQVEKHEELTDECEQLSGDFSVSSIPIQEPTRKSLGSDEDFESFLLFNNYDSKEPLAGDLMSYFDLQLQTPTSSMKTSATLSMSDLLEDEISLRNQRASMSMSDLIDYQSDNELEDGDSESHGDIYFNQDALLETLRRQSKSTNDENVENQPFILKPNNSADLFDSSVVQRHNSEFIFKRPMVDFEDDLTSESPSSLCLSEKTICVNLDSDEGSSISSGCETSSTMTTHADENQLPRRGSVLDRVRSFEQLAESQVTREPLGERGSSGKFYTRTLAFPTGASSGCKSGSFIIGPGEGSVTKSGTLTRTENVNAAKAVQTKHEDDSDELSDESGYVEFQDLSLKSVFA